MKAGYRHGPGSEMALVGIKDGHRRDLVPYHETNAKVKAFFARRGMTTVAVRRGGSQDYKFRMFQRIQRGDLPAASAKAVLADPVNREFIAAFEKLHGPILTP
jgi:hypothetical protein